MFRIIRNVSSLVGLFYLFYTLRYSLKFLLQACLTTQTKQAFNLPSISARRNFWEYVNMMFNNPDLERIRKFGPDRACAEWVLRNGGAVVWANHQKQTDYNLLPSEEQGVTQLLEIDGTNSSISHYGFPHLGKFCFGYYVSTFISQ